MLSVQDLNAGYGKLAVIFHIYLNALEKKITTLVGPNGSGKSTILKAIFSLATIHSGTVNLEGNDITTLAPHEKAKIGMAYLPQLENIFTNLTVKENLRIAGYTLDDNSYSDGLEYALEAFPELKTFMGRKSVTLSGGERQFLAIATALVRKSKLLLLDEPTSQLSPKLAEEMFHRISSLRDNYGLTIILVEQDVQRALEVGDNAYALVSGRVAFQGKAEELIKHKDFEKICMGIC